MEELPLMNNVISVAKALKGSKFGVLSTIEPTMKTIKQFTGLDTLEEVIMLVAIFDRQCTDEQSGLVELADYFHCSSIEIMAYVPSLQSLQSKGFIQCTNIGERDIRKRKFKLYTNVFNAIVEGKEIKPILVQSTAAIDQFVFCKIVHDIIKERRKGCISTKELFAEVVQLEDENPTLTMIEVMKEKFADIDVRVWFYEMCRDFSVDYNGNSTSMNATLNNIYDYVVEGAQVKKNILNESHPLIKENYIEVRNTDTNDADITVRLAENGIRLLFGDTADAYIKSYKCVDKYDFLSKIEDNFDIFPPRQMGSTDYRNIFLNFQNIEKSNQNLPAIANSIKVINDNYDRLLYYRICKKLIDSESFHLRHISETFPTYMVVDIKRQFKNKQHVLQKQGLVEMLANNFLEDSTLVLTNKGKELFLEEDIDLFEEQIADKDIIDFTQIAEKKLFFEPSLEKQLGTLKNSLSEDNVISIRERLKTNNLPTGITALLYGASGTGKTESVFQMARTTGRMIMHVDISQTKSCWFGESEKIIKGVFNKYRKLSKKCQVKPILLFNEADAVFSKRKDVNRSNVAQTENAIQNIILEEMESFDGILIATTNMDSNLDNAFERRFLFKVCFNKPTIDSKMRIWKDKMPHLSDEEAMSLATSFDFSGGEIDNIVRKATIEEVVNGGAPTLERLIILCGEEKIRTKYGKIGFL